MVSNIEEMRELEVQILMNQMISLGKEVVSRRLVVGSGGNLSFRVPGTETFYITATGTQLHELVADSFVLMDLEGKALTDGPKPSSEFKVHLESYKNRQDIEICIHLHPQASVLTASLDLDIKFLTIDHVYYVRKVVRIPWMQSGSEEIGRATGIAMKSTNVVILENHGCVVVAPTVSLGLARILNLEEAAELTLRAQQLGIEPLPVPSAYWERLRVSNL